MTALFVNQLTTLDFSYLSPTRGVVGETWLVDVLLEGGLDDQGMVFDFGKVKKQIKSSLDSLADHRLLVPVAQPSITVERQNQQLTVSMTLAVGGMIQCQAPAQAILLVESRDITPEVLKPFLEETLLAELPDNVRGVTLTIYPQTIEGAFYHYSHGLKKHLGDCQRIAHGHRSPIHIYIDGKRDHQQEAQWAQCWRDIYLATREDLLEEPEVSGVKHWKLGYTSDQGYFELTIPKQHCYMIDTDSTVELLAEHIAHVHKQINPGRTVKVQAFEGFNKGAIAETKQIL